jgi:putative restriction endonuclease
MATPPVTWTRQHTLSAFHLYTLLPFGKLHQQNAEIKQLASWQGRTPSSLAMKLVNFASLDPQITSTGRAGLSGASNQDRALWLELQSNWDKVAIEAADAYSQLAMLHGVDADMPLIEEAETTPIEAGKTRSAVVQVRVNQARFRKAVLATFDSTCCISGLRHEKLLIASHIVPWSQDTTNRLNPQNGLCLSALHDKAYDLGLITVLPDYRIRVSQKLGDGTDDAFIADTLLRYDNTLIRIPRKLKPAPVFLEAHAKRFGFMS